MPADRPAVDVVLPFYGSDAQLGEVAARLEALARRDGDTLTVADNRPGASGGATGAVRVIAAGERPTSYHARNRGAAAGRAPWLVFLDADVLPAPDLLDRYFAQPPAEDVGVLAGAVVDDEPVAGTGTAAERYAFLRSSMDQGAVMDRGQWSFAQTANAAVRREAFEAVGGFEGAVRSGGDADLCFRLRAAGWALEPRTAAVVVHRNRQTVARMLAQRFRHGTGGAWLTTRWPGALPRRRWPGLLWWGVRRAGAGMLAGARGDRDAAVLGLLDGPAVWAFELGRLVPNRGLRHRR